MPRSYRGILVALAGLAVVATSLGTGAFFGALYAPHYGQETTETANRISQPKKGNPSQIDRDRPGLPDFAERVASAPDPENADEREKRDLAAQEAAALWGFWMLVVAGLGTLTTIVGTGFLLWQIMLTREAVQDTGEATIAMRRQNEIAASAQRPYLYVESMGWLKPKYARQFIFQLVIKNFGLSPATSVSVDADVRYSIGGNAPLAWNLRKCSISDLMPQGKSTGVVVESGDTRLAKGGDTNSLLNEDTYCRFEIKYRDTFGNQFGIFETYRLSIAEDGVVGEYRFFSTP